MEHVRGVALRDLQDKEIPQEYSKNLTKCKALSVIQERNALGENSGNVGHVPGIEGQVGDSRENQ